MALNEDEKFALLRAIRNPDMRDAIVSELEDVQTAEIANGAVTNVKVASGIDAVKIGAGSVSNTEFGYLDGVTSAIQTQLNAKQDSSGTAAAAKAACVADAINNGTVDVAPSQNAVFDALALKQDASGTAAAAKAAAVSDTITDGVTDVAPSQNAVFDALALKQDASGTAAAAKAAAVADSIADGVTDVAPSQNAVFDALALKLSLAGGTLDEAANIALGTTTGSKIGTSASQKLGFYNATPIVQPASANQAALTNSTGGSYDGTLAAVSGTGDDATINNNLTDIHTLLNEIRTALVNAGLIKGSA